MESAELQMTQSIIDKVKRESVLLICDAMGEDIRKIVLYGSCSRGDYSEDSDIDIALLVSCDRTDTKKYRDILAEIATKLAMNYFVIVNFVCLPIREFEERKEWYPYFRNIDREGELLYGR
ncbi:MAG: nucleotidyltransferase domain-containing protein [Lachnospiraceae bacterium]|nr:nucleotidyltransferase domain-containing protein [Lachnospiraceae bacterium]